MSFRKGNATGRNKLGQERARLGLDTETSLRCLATGTSLKRPGNNKKSDKFYAFVKLFGRVLYLLRLMRFSYNLQV